MRKKILFLIIILSVIFPFSSFAVETENKVDTWYYIESTFKTKHVFKTKESCEQDRLNYLKQVVKDSTTEVDYLKGTKKESVAECVLEKVSGNPIIETKRVVIVDTLDNKPKTDSTKYRLLAPFAGFTEAPETVGDYLNKIFILAIGLCGAIAVVMLIIAGIQYMGESFSGKASAKGRITNALFGLVIALGAYALLNTLDPRLLGKEGVSIKAVSLDIDPEVHGDKPHSPINNMYCNGRYKADSVWESDAKERDIVLKAGIVVNKNNCTRVGQSDCTSLTGLNTSNVIALKKDCPACEIVITGGTECWLHSNKTQHLPGNSIVDLRTTSSLVSYVEQKNTPIKPTGISFPVFIKKTAQFMKEPSHYHIIKW